MSAVARVARAYAQIAEVDRPEVWTYLRPEKAANREARAIDRSYAAGTSLPLAGLTVAVKDNIDVAGMPTTAGCPAYAYQPTEDAPAVARLRAAGAVVIGKTNLDQFATGLVGTRSPFGAVRDARRPDRVAGGSSSGSAVAVALDITDLALGTDTAGSGRVPAAFQGVVGAKPTVGLVSTRGVVPACRSFDCVSVLAREVELAHTALELMAGSLQPAIAPARPRIGVAGANSLADLSPAARVAYDEAVAAIERAGATTAEVDLAPLFAAGALLYEGAFVAERHQAVGGFVSAHHDDVDPIVAEIILAAGAITAAQVGADTARLSALRTEVAGGLAPFDALLLPTVPFQPTIAAVAADPTGLNARLGRFTTFANLLDLCAYAVPAGEADGGNFGVSMLARGGNDGMLAQLAARFVAARETIPLLVVGAHMTDGPLAHQLTERGGELERAVATAPEYRLFCLNTEPLRPALVRSPSGDGATIEGELWRLPRTGLASLLAALPRPMVLGRVTLADATEVVGFLCEPAAVTDADEITHHGGWRAYLTAQTARRGDAARDVRHAR